MSPLHVGAWLWTALLLLQPAWYLWLAPPANGNGWLALAFVVPPLLLPLIALRTRLRRALLWVGILALFYFTHGVVAAWAVPATRVPAIFEAVLCALLISALGWDVHVRKLAEARST